MATKTYRCIVNALNIRTEPRTADQFKTPEMIKRGETITIDDATLTENDGFLWARHSRGWSAVGSLDGRFLFLSDTLSFRAPFWGINIDPNNPRANPTAPALTNSAWVRFVFHVHSRRESLAQAFAFYDPIIQGYVRAGTNVLLVLLQDTYGGNAPWLSGGSWDEYARGFATTAQEIARHYKGVVGAYQVWNEVDVSGEPTSIFIEPAYYSKLLSALSRAISTADPAALVISSGLASPLSNALSYLREVRKQLGGSLPIDGIGIHPYAHVPPPTGSGPFPTWANLETYLAQFQDSFPGVPLWITEIGVPRVNVEDRALWTRIAQYMENVALYLRDKQAHSVRAITWFAWSDPMDSAGITNADQQPKGAIYNTYFKSTHAALPTIYTPNPTPLDGEIALTHSAGTTLPDGTVDALAARLRTTAPNVRGLILKGSRGVTFFPPNTNAPGVASVGDYAGWAAALSPARVRIHAWHEVVGSDAAKETTLLINTAQAAGVRSIILDLVSGSVTLSTSAAIRAFMNGLRRALPGGYPLGVSFSGRADQISALNVAEWFPFIDFMLPKLAWVTDDADPLTALRTTFAALRTLRKPILPILQVGDGKLTRAAARFATDGSGSPGVGFSNALAAGDLAVVRGVVIPGNAGYMARRVLATQTIATTTLRVRALPIATAEAIDTLNAGERVDILETRSLPPLEWVRHPRGWSVARNTATGEVFLR